MSAIMAFLNHIHCALTKLANRTKSISRDGTQENAFAHALLNKIVAVPSPLGTKLTVMADWTEDIPTSSGPSVVIIESFAMRSLK
jgi:hypothetical protein